MMIPARLAIALQADGWFLRQDIIWSKPNPMPESVRDRCTKAHEYLFLLTKSARYYYDAEAIKETANGNAHARRAVGVSGLAAGAGKHTAVAHAQGDRSNNHATAKRAAGVGPKASAAGSGVKYNESFSAATARKRINGDSPLFAAVSDQAAIGNASSGSTTATICSSSSGISSETSSRS